MTAPAPFSAEDTLDWLQLARSEGVGPLTFARLLARFGSARAAIEALPSLARRPGAPLVLAARDDVLRESERAAAKGWRFLCSGEAAYPFTLRAIEGAPPVLCISGSPANFSRPMVALVGARNASGNGLRMTDLLATGLGTAGYVIVSGLARGVDARAHKAALFNGTVAVLAGGLDCIYPPEHAPLAERIVAEGGVVASEMPIGWVPRGRDFPRRNRIVSGLCLGTVVVEAARRSGSLITARLANEQGREVFAVPGSPLDPRAEGTNDLLRQGATFCTSAADVVDALAPLAAGPAPHSFGPALRLRDQPPMDLAALLDGTPEDDADGAQSGEAEPAGDAARVLALLGPVPMPLDDLVRLSGLTASEARILLVELELAGEIMRRDDGAVARF